MAVASVGLTVAAVALPPLAVALILELGWRDAYRTLGLALLLLVLPVAALVRVRRDRVEGVADRTENARRPRYPRALRRRNALPRVDVPTRRARRLLFVLAAPPLLMTAVVFHAVSLLVDRGLSLTASAVALSLFGAANAVGTVAVGVVGDRTTTRRLLTAISAFLLAGLLTLLAPTPVAAYGGFVLVGLAGGIYVVVMGIVWPRTYGLEGIGRIQGTAWSVQIAGAALGPLPLAVSRALTGGYRVALAALAAYTLAALVVAARWRDPRAVRLGAAAV
jgi:MFS family permease